MDLTGLRLQRIRWAAGSVQMLIGSRDMLLRALARLLAVLGQMTAWLVLLAIPLARLALVALARSLPFTVDSPLANDLSIQVNEGIAVR